MPAWKDCTFSHTNTRQHAVREELLRDLRWCDKKHIETHETNTYDDDSRHPMMRFVEQDCRKGKVVNAKKK